MASLNNVCLIGNLTRDPELRYLPNGTAIGTFILAVNRIKQEGADFIKITCFGKTAENVCDYLSKGSPCAIQGRIRQESWEDKEGKMQYKTGVTADLVQFLGRPKEPSESENTHVEQELDEDVPF